MIGVYVNGIALYWNYMQLIEQSLREELFQLPQKIISTFFR
jgi:hypothetical protein